MKVEELHSVEQLIAAVGEPFNGRRRLFRGQEEDWPLLPKVARGLERFDTTSVERQLIHGLRYRGGRLFPKEISDWELLCIAQHYGAATRLLDWTSNPLAALWMALANVPWPSSTNDYVYVYFFDVLHEWLIPSDLTPGPFEIDSTRVLQPPLNNDRVVAQSGWFTVHRFQPLDVEESTMDGFVPLEQELNYAEAISKLIFPLELRDHLLLQLDQLGVNAHTMYTGIEGLCKHISWEFERSMLGARLFAPKRPILKPV